MKNKFFLSIFFLFFIFCFVVLYEGLNKPNNYIPQIKNMKNLPNFQAKDFNLGFYVNSKKIFKENNYYIVNIWASWCAPCRKEHPFLMELSNISSIKLIGINYKDNLDKAKKFIDEFGNPYSQILVDHDGTLGVEFGAFGVPETFLVDKDKIIIKKYIGPINQNILKEIKSIIK